MTLTDTHVHFFFPDYDSDREDVIERARTAGVGYFVNVGTDLTTSENALDFVREREGFYAAVGIHPHEAGSFSDRLLPRWKELAARDKVVAIGEVGLDFFRNHASREDQEKLFRASCDVAEELELPLILHVRDAFPDVFKMLGERFPEGYRGVFHCFSGDVAAMERAIQIGFHISLAGPVTYKKNDALRDVARRVSADRLLLETDAPFLPPQSMRGKRNESSLLVETARTVADARGVSLDALAEMTTENARRLFGFEKAA